MDLESTSDMNDLVDLSKGLESVPVLIQRDSEEPFPRFQYSPDMVEGPGCPVDPSEVTLPGCSCRSFSCSAGSCPCQRTRGPAYDSAGVLLNASGTDAAYCLPVFECNALCACSDACSNRVVQWGLRLRTEVYGTGSRGWGARTLEPVPRGTFVCEYAGEVIGLEEARRRQRPEENNYIIAVREHAGPGSVTETFVDPALVGNVGRFLNHSCLPNLLMLPVRVHSLVPRLALFAGRDIDAREELTFDYSGGCGSQNPVEPGSPQSAGAARASRTHGLQRKTCHCGAERCAKFLPLDVSVLS